MSERKIRPVGYGMIGIYVQGLMSAEVVGKTEDIRTNPVIRIARSPIDHTVPYGTGHHWSAMNPMLTLRPGINIHRLRRFRLKSEDCSHDKVSFNGVPPSLARRSQLTKKRNLCNLRNLRILPIPYNLRFVQMLVAVWLLAISAHVDGPITLWYQRVCPLCCPYGDL